MPVRKNSKPVVKRSGKARDARKRAARAKKGQKAAMLTPYQHLLVDPCHGPLVRGPGFVDGVGVVQRNRLTTTAAYGNGYLVWFPSYQGAGNYGGTYAFKPQNLFFFENGLTNVQPTNTGTFPLGTSTTSTTGLWLTDPSWASVSGGAFSRSRCISACIQAEFLGSLSTIKGQTAIVTSMPLSVLNRATTGSMNGTIVFPSVDEIFSYALVRERLDLKGHEVRYRPTDTDTVLRDDCPGYSGHLQSHGSVPDALFWSGDATSTTTSVIQTTTPRMPLPSCLRGAMEQES